MKHPVTLWALLAVLAVAGCRSAPVRAVTSAPPSPHANADAIACAASAQSQPATADAAEQPTAEEHSKKVWEFTASANFYVVPGGKSYLQPTFTADRDWLHLEGRYNYEALDTASAWIGYNFDGGDAVEWEVTPMVGAVFGETSGLAPGYKGSVSWKRLELYSEGELVFDSTGLENSYFYNWSELTVSPVDGLKLGLVTQRTRAYETDRDLQRGVLLGFTSERLNATVYVFNPDDADPMIVFAISFDF